MTDIKAIGLTGQDLHRMNWWGIKPMARDLLVVPPINALAIGLARMTSASWAGRLPVNRRAVAFRTLTGDEVRLLDPVTDQVARELFWHDGKLSGRGDQLAMTALEYMAAESSLFLDIGAYTGLFALVAAKVAPAVKAVAFEIVPDNYILLSSNIVENDLIGRVEARLMGVGPGPGELVMPRSTGMSSRLTSLSLNSTFAEGVRIPVDSLDNLYADHPGLLSMKIDVEGFEAQIFAGGARVLARKPDMICEILRNRGEEVEAMLKPLGYRFWRFTDDGLKPETEIRGVRGERDWLFTARPDADAFVARIEAATAA